MPLRELILVRHALPVRVEQDDGVADPGLTPLGHEQARRMAMWLADEVVDHLVVSPKLRARETAAPLEERLGRPARVIEAFAEMDRSAKAYVPLEEMVNEENSVRLQQMMNRDWGALGYLDPDTFRKEVGAATDELLAEVDGTVVVVAHGGTINAMITHLLGWDEVFFFQPFYTSISRILPGWVQPEQLRIGSINETGHLHAVRGSHEALPER